MDIEQLYTWIVLACSLMHNAEYALYIIADVVSNIKI